MSMFHSLQDFYLTLLLEQVLSKSTSVAGARQACSWSQSFGSLHPGGIQVQLSSVHQSRVWRSPLSKLLQNLLPIQFEILRFMYPELSWCCSS